MATVPNVTACGLLGEGVAVSFEPQHFKAALGFTFASKPLAAFDFRV